MDGLVALEVEHPLQVLKERIEGRVLIIRRAAALDLDMWCVGEIVFQRLQQARFANAGLATERDDVSLALLYLSPAGQQQGDFRRAPDQGREAARGCHLQATLDTTLAQGLIHVERRGHPSQALEAQRLAGKIPLDELPGSGTEHH